MDQDIWQNILDKLEENLNEQSFKTWFSNTELMDFNDNNMIIKVPTKFAADFLNKNYTALITEISFAIYKNKYKATFTSEPLLIQNKKKEKKKNNRENNYNYKTINTLNEKYVFSEFVVGKSNNFAHSASMAVAETPGTIYNPLFIYGESGMGKTHLMHAIGHFVLEEKSKKNVLYLTTEQFTNEMIESIKSNTMSKFRNKFRNIDLLLIDDIHFLSKKEGTQEEFFHTFNTLYESKKQIVMTSDRPPKDIKDLESRLVTRFEWGLLADLKNPDFETRVAILRKKAESENIDLSEETLYFMAENIHNNVRSLEGSLTRLMAFASCENINPKEINPETAKEVLNTFISNKVSEVNMDTIMKKVCSEYGITPEQILDKTRKKNIAFPRQVAMYISNMLIPQISLKEIAHYYKRKDHTTVLHAKKMIENLLRKDGDVSVQVEKLIKNIKS